MPYSTYLPEHMGSIALEPAGPFAAGDLVLPSGFTPTIDTDVLAAHVTACERFMPTTAGWTAPIN